MPLDVKKWAEDIAKKGQLSQEEVAQLEAIFGKPGVKQELVDGFERQSDYSRNIQALQQQKAEEDAYAARLAQWETEVKNQLAQAQQEANAYKTQVYTIAQQYNLSPNELQNALSQAGVQQTPSPAPAAKPAEDPKWMTREQAAQEATALLRINAKIIGFNQDHIRLFGKPMENIDVFIDEALKAGQSGVKIEDTFRNFYKVADREGELREADVQTRIAKAIEEEKLKWATTAANPLAAAHNGAIPKGYQSPVMENVADLDNKVLGDQAAHRTRVQEAIAAFNAAQAQSGLPTL